MGEAEGRSERERTAPVVDECVATNAWEAGHSVVIKLSARADTKRQNLR